MSRSPRDLPPEAQEMIGELQQQQQQLQKMNEHKGQIKAQQKHIERAFEALEDVDEDEDVFKVVGPVGIKYDKKELEEELSDMKARMDSQLETVEDKENEIREKAENNQKKLQQMMSGGQ